MIEPPFTPVLPRKGLDNKDNRLSLARFPGPAGAAVMTVIVPFSLQTLSLQSLAGRLLSHAPARDGAPSRSDFDLNPDARAPRPAGLTEAAVLIPIVLRDAPTVLFTERAAHLAHHPGQVSFPGGRAEPEDGSPAATALRELQEETGIAADFVTVAGFMLPYETVTGFAVQPVVGLVREGFTLAPDAREVEAIFEVPLAYFLDPAHCRTESLERGGIKRHFYAYRPGDRYIWGATAAILRGLGERLR